MPAFTGTAVETELLGALQHTLNGDTSILVPSAQSFFDPANSDAPNFRYDGFVTKRGTLSEASGVCVAALPAPQNSTQTLTLSSSHEAAQFRVGDACFLVGNAYAGAVGAVANTADGPLTVVSTSPVNQTVTVTGRNNAGGPPATSDFAAGSSLVVVSASAPGAMVNSASAGAPLYNQSAASLLRSLEAVCSSTVTGQAGTFSTTRFDVNIGGAFVEYPSVEGGTLTFLTGTAANIGCTAKILLASGAGPVRLDLYDIRDADGNSIAELPATTAAADTARLTLDLSEGKLVELGEAGGDLTRLVPAILTMHRKLDAINAGLGLTGDSPEVPLVNEWNMWGQMSGTILRSTAAYVNASDSTVEVALDGAVGDIPFPLSGQIRAINAQDGVDNTEWATTPSGSTWVAYTRQKRSNVLTLTAGVGALGANYAIGSMIELRPTVNGFAKTSGISPDVPGKYLSGLLWQLAETVRNYVILGA